MNNVFEKIGGMPSVEAAVDRFYDYMLEDDRVKHFFTDVDMDKQRRHQKAFIAYALGADTPWTGKSLREAHKHLNLTDEAFDATAENLGKALIDLKVPDELIADVSAIVESTRQEILNKS